MSGHLDEWEALGERIELSDGEYVWAARLAADRDAGNPPALLLHGFPTCSYDWRPVLAALRAERDVVLFDFLGFGLSAKPDRRYSLRLHADTTEAVARHFELSVVDLVTHDMGDSVGGELLARSLEGTLGFEVRRRVLTNGSIYLDMAHLTDGQNLLLSLPDAVTPIIGADRGVAWRRAIAATYAPGSSVDEAEIADLYELAARDDGLPMMARTIRYIEDRRAEERRFTGAIEQHPSPLAIVWGNQDPIAVVAMADALRVARPDAKLTILGGVGHYPMIESPGAFATAVLIGFAS
ncbi:MAG TPA: alpha/beta hydrolase [Ilumatobacter sp.]|nr:alpha/beta hydrolase [Ilumatobacter sp.]